MAITQSEPIIDPALIDKLPFHIFQQHIVSNFPSRSIRQILKSTKLADIKFTKNNIIPIYASYQHRSLNLDEYMLQFLIKYYSLDDIKTNIIKFNINSDICTQNMITWIALIQRNDINILKHFINNCSFCIDKAFVAAIYTGKIDTLITLLNNFPIRFCHLVHALTHDNKVVIKTLIDHLISSPHSNNLLHEDTNWYIERAEEVMEAWVDKPNCIIERLSIIIHTYTKESRKMLKIIRYIQKIINAPRLADFIVNFADEINTYRQDLQDPFLDIDDFDW